MLSHPNARIPNTLSAVLVAPFGAKIAATNTIRMSCARRRDLHRVIYAAVAAVAAFLSNAALQFAGATNAPAGQLINVVV